MNDKMIQVWHAVRYSLWFVPGLMTAAACALGLGIAHADQVIAQSDLSDHLWLYSGSPEGARTMLSTIAGSMITVAGVVFSLTMVVLSLTASQFGPSLVRNFMDDTGNQLVLGTFVATFVYCLVVMHTTGSDGEKSYVPQLSVSVGVGLALTSLAVLIYFIHHITASIHVNRLLANLGHDLEWAIRKLCPEELGEENRQEASPAAPDLPKGFDIRAAELRASKSGYLTMVNQHLLLKLAVERDLLIKLAHRTGDFLFKGEPLALVWPSEGLSKEAAAGFERAYSLEVQRDKGQDPVFIAQQLAETALRALSPGVNDPFTALTCIDWLASGMALLAGRRIPPPYCEDEAGDLRVVLIGMTMETLIREALDPIRRAGRESVMCTQRLLGAVGNLARQTYRKDDLAALRGLALRVKEDSLRHINLAWDRQEIADLYEKVVLRLDESERRNQVASTMGEPGPGQPLRA